MEPAAGTKHGGHEGGQHRSIQPQEAEKEEPGRQAGRPQRSPHPDITPAPPRATAISSTTSRVFAPRISGRAAMTTSNPARTWGATEAHAARRSRRARVRSTADPIFRPATKAARLSPAPGATYTTTRFERNGDPSRRTRLISAELLRRGRGEPDACASFGGTGEAASGPEPGSALGPSPGKDLSTRAGPHPESEPVGLLPSSGVGLIGTFHGVTERQTIIGGPPRSRQRSAPKGAPSGRPGHLSVLAQGRRARPRSTGQKPFGEPQGFRPWRRSLLNAQVMHDALSSPGTGV